MASVGMGVIILPSFVSAQSCPPDPPPDPCLGGANPPPEGNNAPDCSPIIIDTAGNGFQLTSAREGVQFDITGTRKPIQIAWTAQGSMNAFLVFDRNNDGLINSGAELFGNFSPQPQSRFPNGFLALAEFDKPSNGGNGDGVIDSHDAIFSELRLWIDLNHDGISQPNELLKLPDLGVLSISLDYQESRRTDQYGNLFRYRTRINVIPGERDQSDASPMAYDVFLTTK
ncbi:MAG TPA: hypothetical protein VGJ30_08335 [Candidatus Angelobacter sp.]